MPILQPVRPTALPSDTGIPGLTRRRVWAMPEVTSHSLIVLTLPRIYLAPSSGVPNPALVAAIDKGADVETLLGPFATVVDLVRVTRVHHDMVANRVRLEYLSPNGGTARVAMTFATAEGADALFAKIWRRLGTEFRLFPYRPEAWTLARVPGLAILGVLASTAILALARNALDDVAGQRLPWLDRLPGWQLVCGLGGAAAAALTVWLYRRLTGPPERLELARE